MLQTDIVAEVEHCFKGLVIRALEERCGDDLRLKDIVDAVLEVGYEIMRNVVEVTAAEKLSFSDGWHCCPDCGRKDFLNRYVPLKMRTVLGNITCRRAYYWCECGCTHMSGDSQLWSMRKGWSDELVEAVSLAGCLLPSFSAASDMMRRFLRVRVGAKQVERLTEGVGHAVVFERDEQIPSDPNGALDSRPRKKATRRKVVQMDGAMVNTLDGWKEVKAAVIYDPEQSVPVLPDSVIPMEESTGDRRPTRRRRGPLAETRVIGHVGGVERFEDLLSVALVQENVHRSAEIAVIGDGAEWIWNRAGALLPKAIQILDWFHVTEHVWACTRTLFGEGTDQSKQWARKIKDLLWDGKIRTTIATARQLRTRTQEHEQAIADLIRYVFNNRHRMKYPEFRAHGWEIGSGVIESTHKRVVAARLKQAGMRWRIDSAEAVIELRCQYFSGSWDDFWKRAA